MNSKSVLMLNQIRGSALSVQERINKSLELAEILFKQAADYQKKEEKQKESWLSKIMDDPAARHLLTTFCDGLFRSTDHEKTLHFLQQVLKKTGIPRSFPDNERFFLVIFKHLSPVFPKTALYFLKRKVLSNLKGILFWGSEEEKIRLIRESKLEGIRINLNHIGESILGEKEALNRLETYKKDLLDPSIEYVSIKISSLYSQINLAAFDATLKILQEKFRILLRLAQPHQFINLDMEEYKDLDLTLALFKTVLEETEFRNHSAGIALQAYIPDSLFKLEELIAWAKQRKGAPIRVRLVKGANLAMEKIESSQKNWMQAPYEHKWETDANFKKMLDVALNPETYPYVQLAVASHNLFDLSYALVLAYERGIGTDLRIEMLSGMAPSLQRAIIETQGEITLYLPQTEPKFFHNALSYLFRRFEENASSQNFLRQFYNLFPHNFLWNQESKHFQYAALHQEALYHESRRSHSGPSWHSPTLDLSKDINREFVRSLHIPPSTCLIPIIINGQSHLGEIREGTDPSTGNALYTYHSARAEHIDLAFSLTKKQCQPSVFEKIKTLMQQKRGMLTNLLMADGGKIFEQADAEVCEAIDFITYYTQSWEKKGAALGTVLVAPPWNFPLAITTGGLVSALLTGNSVIFKPSSETVLVGYALAQLFWQAGVDPGALAFVPCFDKAVKDYLVSHPQLAGIILTGHTETAEHLQKARPDIPVIAETGGKNAIIISALSDKDAAIRDLIASAFGHSGQKCSACSLAVLEKEVYQSEAFLSALKNATESLAVGPVWSPTSKIGPLIKAPDAKLLRALTTLDEGESWLVQPKKLKENLWSPGVKLGIKRGSFFHQTECFGPVLGVMCADNLSQAVELVNDTPYGLTSGLHSLDEQEQDYFIKHLEAGNLYINRTITGAIVGRQPFGGCKASSVGPGKKAGGPLYCDQLVIIENPIIESSSSLPQSIVNLLPNLSKLSKEEQVAWKQSAESYSFFSKKYQQPQELDAVLGQKNTYYLVPKSHVTIRYNGEPFLDLLRVITACLICNVPYTVSSVKPLDIPCIQEDEIHFLSRKGMLRALSKTSNGPGVINSPVHSCGKYEVLHYLREISISFDYHRYGYLGEYDITEHSTA